VISVRPIACLFSAIIIFAAVPVWFGNWSQCATADDSYIYGSEDDGTDRVDNQFGPYDYYRPPAQPPKPIALVERHHMGFVIKEQLRTKDYCGYFGSLNYTLRAFPNHPQALKLMGEFLIEHPPCYITERRKWEASAPLSQRSAEILEGRWQEMDGDFFFERALRFMTEDTRVIPKHAETHVLFGDWLRKQGRREEAMKQYVAARALNPRFADSYYGLGMLYLDMKDAQMAVENAKKAYALGKPPAELRDRLIAAKAWPDTTDEKTQR
jgi:hypothetical protein